MNKIIWLWNHDATRMFKDQGGRHYWFSEKLKERGYSPIIFCSNINHFNGEEMLFEGNYKLEEVNGIPFVFVKTTPYSGNGYLRIKNWISFYRGLFKIFKDTIKILGRPDVILASSVHPLTIVAGIRIAKRIGIPCIAEVRDLWPEAFFTVGKVKERSLLGAALKSGEYWMYKKAQAIIFTKEGDIDYLKEQKWLISQGGKIDPKKCFYINNGIDYPEYQRQIIDKQLKDPDLEDGKFHVVYAGTIRQVNNVENIINAAILLKNDLDIEFLIYGEGDYKANLENRAISAGLDNVKFKGYVNRQYIPYILSRSSVNLLNYAQDLYNWKRGNSSNKMFEYLASGKPILSTVKMGYDILERYKCGFSLSQCTAKKLAEGILMVKNLGYEEYSEMGKRAKEAAKEFDFTILTTKLEEVINFAEAEFGK